MSATEDQVETAGPPAGNATTTPPAPLPPSDVKKESPVSSETTPPAPDTVTEKEAGESVAITAGSKTADELQILRGPNGEEYPTKEELGTLRRVKGKIHWIIYTVAFCELCERFAYYGTTQVFVNFISEPLPPGSDAGAGGTYGQSGALGMGQQASTGLTLFNSFWSYLMPLFGAYMADTYWGKFKTINVAIGLATFGHILIIVSALPPVIKAPNNAAMAPFIIGLIFFGMGVGFFKTNISPLIAEQYESTHPRATVKTLASGERVIEDPIMTISVIYMRYYFFINVGSLVGQISMVYAEKYVGFWLSFTLPTIMFLICPMVMFWCRNKYVRLPPTGSVLGKSMGIIRLGMKGRWSLNPITTFRHMASDDFWERAKPSKIEDRPAWMTFDDAWVDEVRRGFKACTVFFYYPIYWLPYNQLYNNLVSQAATMKLGGVPNDIVNNLDPIALLIFIPITDKFIYPAIARTGFKLTPIKKITLGFAFGTLAMVSTAVVQHYIYVDSPCGDHPTKCDAGPPPHMSVWIQTPAYVLIAFAEIAASITGLEYAFTKAPKNMRSLITAVFWFAQAISSAIAQAFVPLAKDPLLVWLYITVTIIACLGGVGFWFTFRRLDAEEEALNTLPDSEFHGSRNKDEDPEATVAVKARQEEQRKLREAQGLEGTHVI
ncbi:POT family proton-dependent oligopeptide transporter [Apiospora rasikravindrae]|uniref:POT family proton-dependent oligopeptide transporter n=1 Tax=Apiospora rasikravindrae TaxID=990691 RepID=A0ABR1RRC3_9PEZI